MSGPELYLDLLKQTLTRTGFQSAELREIRPRGRTAPAWNALQKVAARRGYRIMYPAEASWTEGGRGWPAEAETMIGRARLDNVQHCVETVIADGIPGDLIETGVWRGGATIFMRGVLAAHGVTDRIVWCADSFAGLPAPTLPQDAGLDLHEHDVLAVSLDQVKHNFERYRLLDDQVQFLEGWFKDTLPAAPIDQLAVARLDGDLYESTWDAITVLYPKLSSGGFLIVDDYGDIPACAQAIEDYRTQNGIDAPIEKIDFTGVFWRKA
jgi:O-methyltransferase